MPSSSVRAESFTTRLRNDASSGAEILEKTTKFITDELPGLRTDLLKVIQTHGSVEAQQALMNIDRALRNVGAAVAINQLLED